MLLSIGLVLLIVWCESGRGQVVDPPNQSCLCVNANNVPVRNAPCGDIIGSANPPECFFYVGPKVTCDLAGTLHDFYSLDYNSKESYVMGDSLRLGTENECSKAVVDWPWTSGNCSNIQIVSREEWGARPPTQPIPTIPLPVNYLFIHYSNFSSCTDLDSCIINMKEIQDYHLDVQGWWDIGYNYVIGEDGLAYVARDWESEGAHTRGFNRVGVAICVMGQFNVRRPMDIAMQAVNNLIDCALRQGVILPDFKMEGHRDATNSSTDCPGDAFYPQIQTWPYYCFDTTNATNPGEPCETRPQ